MYVCVTELHGQIKASLWKWQEYLLICCSARSLPYHEHYYNINILNQNYVFCTKYTFLQHTFLQHTQACYKEDYKITFMSNFAV